MFSPDTKTLIVDDMASIRDLVKGHLKTLGFKTILEAENGKEAMTKVIQADAAGSPIQLIISDWNMPLMNGIDFLKQIRAHQSFSKLPFLLLTSESERDQVTEAVLAGVSQYVVKPFSGKIFEDKLKAVWMKHKDQ